MTKERRNIELPDAEEPSEEGPDAEPEETPNVEELAEKLPNMAEPLEIEAEASVIFVVVPDSGQVRLNPHKGNNQIPVQSMTEMQQSTLIAAF